jgi:hypothetical protein
MRRRWVTVPVIAALAAAVWAATAQPAAALGYVDLQVKQSVLLLRGYIDTQAAQNGFLYPTKAQVQKGGGLVAPIWPLNPWTGKTMAPGTGRGTYTYTPVADRHGYTLVAHYSSGSARFTGASPAWLKTERQTAAADLGTARAQATAAQDDLAAVRVELTTVQGDFARAQADLSTIRGERDAVQADLATAKEERDAAVADLKDVQTQRDAAVADLTTARTERDAAKAERDAAVAGLTIAQAERDSAEAGLTAAQAARDAARADLAAAQSQLASANDAQTELGARILRGYIQQWGMLNNATTPPAAQISATGIGAGQGFWPVNPWSGWPMAVSAANGDVSYSEAGSAFSMSAHLSGPDANLDGAVPQQLKTAMTALRDKLVVADIEYLRATVDRYAFDYSDAFPTELNADTVGTYTLGEWPVNPWTNLPMKSSAGRGDFMYTTSPAGYVLSGNLSDGSYTVDDVWAERASGVRIRLKDMCAQGYAQIIKDYAEQWAANHGGLPPTPEQLAATGEVGSAHSWWPANPWTGSAMSMGTNRGDYSYVTNGTDFVVTLHQQPVAERYPGDPGAFPPTYTAQ